MRVFCLTRCGSLSSSRSEPVNATGSREPANNARLKKIVADLTLDREMLQDTIRRKL